MPVHLSATGQPLPRLASSRSRAALLLFAVFAFFLAAYTLTASSDIFSTGDTTIRVELAENLMGRASVCFHGWKLDYPAHLKKEYLDPRVDKGVTGCTVSTYELGQPLAIMPLDFLGSHWAVHMRWPYGPTVLFVDRLVGPIFGALEVLIFFLFAFYLGFGLRRALLLSLIFGFATTVWPDEQSVLEHTEVAFFLLLGMYGAFRYREHRLGWRWLVLCGVGIGGAAMTRYQDAFLGLLGVAVYLALPGGPGTGVIERVRRGLWVGAGILPFAIVDLWYSWIRFGKLFASGHHETVFGYTIWKGALGLTVSPGKGLIWYCPAIFLLVLAAPRFVRRYGALSLGFATIAVAFTLLYGYVTYWHGDPAWGPRYMYPVVPFLILPLGELLRWRGRSKRLVWLVMAGIVGISLLIQVSAVSVSPWRSWYRVIAYEENLGFKWQWIAARYRYFWNIHESPLDFQVHGLYQLAYDDLFQSNKYVLVPPDEDPFLVGLTNSYSINQWNFWWASNELSWWMGTDKIVAGVVFLLAIMLASGTYLVAESSGLWEAPGARREDILVPEPEAA